MTLAEKYKNSKNPGDPEVAEGYLSIGVWMKGLRTYGAKKCLWAKDWNWRQEDWAEFASSFGLPIEYPGAVFRAEDNELLFISDGLDTKEKVEAVGGRGDHHFKTFSLEPRIAQKIAWVSGRGARIECDGVYSVGQGGWLKYADGSEYLW